MLKDLSIVFLFLLLFIGYIMNAIGLFYCEFGLNQCMVVRGISLFITPLFPFAGITGYIDL